MIQTLIPFLLSADRESSTVLGYTTMSLSKTLRGRRFFLSQIERTEPYLPNWSSVKDREISEVMWLYIK
jgi:hypothetical protein